MKWETDAEVQELMERLVIATNMTHVRSDRVFCVRGEGSTSRAIARIWALPRVFQQCLEIDAAYVIEVLNKPWDKLSEDDKEKTMIHELLHIPKTFSGALVPHKCFGKRRVGSRQVDKLWKEMKQNQSSHTWI